MSALEVLRGAWRTFVPATMLYTPGNDEHKIGKVGAFGSDAVVLDLEDAVADEEKVAARSRARAGVESLPDTLLRFIRVNNAATRLTQDDVTAIVGPSLDGVMYPKVEHPDELWDLDRWLGRAEREAGLEIGHTVVIGLIETAYGFTEIDRLLGRVPDRVLTVAFGLGDYSVDLGIELGDYRHQLDFPRARINVAARAHRLAPPVDGPWLRLQDLEGLHADCERSRSFGFGGRQLIYPSHVPVALADYLGVDDDRRAHFERVVVGFEAAVADGRAALQVDGLMVDYPIYHRARRALADADRLRRLKRHIQQSRSTPSSRSKE